MTPVYHTPASVIPSESSWQKASTCHQWQETIFSSSSSTSSSTTTSSRRRTSTSGQTHPPVTSSISSLLLLISISSSSLSLLTQSTPSQTTTLCTTTTPTSSYSTTSTSSSSSTLSIRMTTTSWDNTTQIDINNIHSPFSYLTSVSSQDINTFRVMDYFIDKIIIKSVISIQIQNFIHNQLVHPCIQQRLDIIHHGSITLNIQPHHWLPTSSTSSTTSSATSPFTSKSTHSLTSYSTSSLSTSSFQSSIAPSLRQMTSGMWIQSWHRIWTSRFMSPMSLSVTQASYPTSSAALLRSSVPFWRQEQSSVLKKEQTSRSSRKS